MSSPPPIPSSPPLPANPLEAGPPPMPPPDKKEIKKETKTPKKETKGVKEGKYGVLTSKLGPDIKSDLAAPTPSLPPLCVVLPLLLYAWIGWSLVSLGLLYWDVQQRKKQYPLDMAERQQLEQSTATNQQQITLAEEQFQTFRKWKGWITESPPLTPIIANILNAINNDVRINTLSIVKSVEAPNQIKLTLRAAFTETDPVKQFETILSSLNDVGWSWGGNVEQTVDVEGPNKWPTPSGVPREVFYRLDVTLVEKMDLTTPITPILDTSPLAPNTTAGAAPPLPGQ